MNWLGRLSRDSGQTRVPVPPHMITGRILLINSPRSPAPARPTARASSYRIARLRQWPDVQTFAAARPARIAGVRRFFRSVRLTCYQPGRHRLDTLPNAALILAVVVIAAAVDMIS